MGGIWECHIRSVYSILPALLKKHKTFLEDESLHTLVAEVESITNSKPLLTAETMSENSSMALLCPNNILTVKTSVPVPLPGVFMRPDLYNRCPGRGASILQKNFGVDGRKSFLSACKKETNSVRSPENLRSVTFYY